MSDDELKAESLGDEAPPEQYEYIEEVAEYRDTRLVRILLSVILVILALLLAYLGYRIWQSERGQGGAPAEAESGGMTWIRSIYGWGSAPEEQLIAPNTVTVDAEGLIWTNTNNRAAIAFNPDGSFDRRIDAAPSESASSAAGTESTQTSTPQVTRVFSLAADRGGNLYVCDNAEGTVLQVTSEAGIRQGWEIPGVNKIAASDERVVALSGGGIGVFDPVANAPVFSFGARGPGKLQFDSPWGAWVDDENNVYVADTQNRRVRKFDPRGTLVWDAGTVPDRSKPETMESRQESAKDLFALPTGVTVDGNGRVVVVDAFKFEIIVLDPDTGEKIASYGRYGQADGFFDNPAAITYDEERDYFVVADTGNNRLQVIRLPGSSSNAAVAGLRRLFDRPVWLCCFPFILLLLAIVVLVARRRREGKAESPEVAGDGGAPHPVA